MSLQVQLKTHFRLNGGVLQRQSLGTKVKTGFDKDGYRYVHFKGKTYPEHHLVWCWHKGELPTGDIDHIDMNRSNNHISNLRECSRSQNMLNTKAHKDSKSGVKNVYYRKDTGKWSVRMSIDGGYKSLGCFDCLELAEFVAEEGRNRYHGEFANHG